MPFVGNLPIGEIQFRVLAADPNAAKMPRTANSPGRYLLGDRTHLLVRQLTESYGRAAILLDYGLQPWINIQP